MDNSAALRKTRPGLRAKQAINFGSTVSRFGRRTKSGNYYCDRFVASSRRRRRPRCCRKADAPFALFCQSTRKEAAVSAVFVNTHTQADRLADRQTRKWPTGLRRATQRRRRRRRLVRLAAVEHTQCCKEDTQSDGRARFGRQERRRRRRDDTRRERREASG